MAVIIVMELLMVMVIVPNVLSQVHWPYEFQSQSFNSHTSSINQSLQKLKVQLAQTFL
jgi:hypothetical protein